MTWNPLSPPTVAIFGAGVAGLTAAHELAERGFRVTLYEQGTTPGGKAATQYASYLGNNYPFEHGFRLYPAFYKHVIDSMKRIKFGSGWVSDNLIPTTVAGVARHGKPLQLVPRAGANTLQGLLQLAQQSFSAFTGDELPWQDAYRFQTKILQFLTTCDARRNAEYEYESWWTFIDGARYVSDAFKAQIQAFVKTMVAMDAMHGSACTVGKIAVQLLLDATTDGSSTDRVMNGPTSEKWLMPWLAMLMTDYGANFEFFANHELRPGCIHFSPGFDHITGVTVYNPPSIIPLTKSFDYYVFALPMGVLQQVLAPQAANFTDVQLQKICTMDLLAHTDWCAGAQFLLKNDAPLVRGHVYYPDSAWALSSVSQAQFWDPANFKSTYGHGVAGGILSVDVCNWRAPGRFVAIGKPGVACTGPEVVDEIWDQLNDALFDGSASPIGAPGERYWFHLDDDILFGSPPPFTDPSQIGVEPALNLTAHFIHPPGAYAERPTVETTLDNFLIATDYVQTTTDLACMEGANEAGRRAANALITRAGCPAAPCQLWPLTEPSFLDVYKQLDAQLFALGDPHALQILGVENLAGLLPPIGDLLGVLASLIP